MENKITIGNQKTSEYMNKDVSDKATYSKKVNMICDMYINAMHHTRMNEELVNDRCTSHDKLELRMHKKCNISFQSKNR